MSLANFTIGCDPELFLRKNGKAISAYDLIPGSKEAPHKTDGGAIQPDGLSAEFNTDPVPLTDFVSFNANIVKQFSNIRKVLADKDINLAVVPVMDFDPEYLEAQPDGAKELGCDPDFNAYTVKKNPRPDADKVSFRSGAGHIHFGWGADIPVDNEEHLNICARFIKMLDATVGMFMTFIDTEPRRRELYGKAGAFRPKPYGVEYRTPSNAWIVNRDLRQLTHDLCKFAVTKATQGKNVMSIIGLTDEQVQDIINSGDVKTAETYVNHCFSMMGKPRLWKKVRDEILEKRKDS